MLKRKFMRYIAAGAASLTAALLAPSAFAQNFPAGPISLVNPYAAGGPADVLARIIIEPMAATLGQPIVLVNKPGGATAVAASSVSVAPKDGHTLLMANASSHIVTPLLSKVTYDGIKDFSFICMIATVNNVLVVREGLPAKSVPELVALAKSKPGALTYASVGNGSQPHLAGELFQQMTDTKLTHVPYRGAAPATVDLLAGQIDLGILNAPPLLEHIKTGKLRALGISSLKRSEQLPGCRDARRAGPQGLQRRDLVWHFRAGRHATCRDRENRCRVREVRQFPRRESEARRSGRRDLLSWAEGIHGLSCRRRQTDERPDQERQYQRRVDCAAAPPNDISLKEAHET